MIYRGLLACHFKSRKVEVSGIRKDNTMTHLASISFLQPNKMLYLRASGPS